MLRSILIVALLLFKPTPHHQEAFFQLSVQIQTSETPQGKLYVTLHNSENSFQNDAFFQFKKLDVLTSTSAVVFDSLPKGNYALKVFHDLNDNGKLDTSFLGLPKEPYGFSNNAMGNFGPPSFEQSIIVLTQNLEHQIQLR
jgi:uncharacterized protein (DUF2141 family)